MRKGVLAWAALVVASLVLVVALGGARGIFRNIPAGCDLDQGQQMTPGYGRLEFYGDTYFCAEL